MRLSHRIFIVYCVLIAIAALLLLRSVNEEMRPAMRKATEDTMVDATNVLAEFIGSSIGQEKLRPENVGAALLHLKDRNPNAPIWDSTKTSVDSRVYITDQNGVVVFDSDDGKAVGQDYSRWNDVYLTLRGKYGARSTRTDPGNELTTVMYVAAPIKRGDEIIGVLTMSKPVGSIEGFLEVSRRNIAWAAAILMLTALGLGWLLSGRLTRSIRRLANYADAVREGRKATIPHMREPDLAALTRAVDSMRQELEGKDYVESYVHGLTHEIKSPLSGLIGATELLDESMPEGTRRRFVANIRDDAKRIQDIVDRLLELAKVEQRQTLEQAEEIDLPTLVAGVVARREARLQSRGITVKLSTAPSEGVIGERFLIEQAIGNVFDNAIDFVPDNSEIDIRGAAEGDKYALRIEDSGPGVPDYAAAKIFDRFYSLPRPGTAKKSSGLGLTFVREIMALHAGSVSLARESGKTVATLTFPRR